MANLVLAFGELLAGGVLVDAAVKGASIGDVIRGVATSTSTTATSSAAASTDAAGATSSTAPAGPIGPVGTAGPGASNFSTNQRLFANRLAADTGLDINVILAWMQDEQPPGSASAPNGANNWLNVGSTDSGFLGGNNPAWSNPITAADETSTWLHGNSIFGYPAPVAGIRAILSTAGQAAAAQIRAIQTSGWASSGYPELMQIYQGIVG